jgi:hypothetical protein
MPDLPLEIQLAGGPVQSREVGREHRERGSHAGQ